MSKIKTREVVKGSVKTIDRNKILIEKTKSGIKNNTEKKDDDANNYAIDKINISSKKIVNKDNISNLRKTKENISYVRSKIKKDINQKKSQRLLIKKGKKGVSHIAKETAKNVNRAKKLAVETTKKTYQALKVSIKVFISSIKYVIAGTKILIGAIIGGGTVSVIIIVILCLLGYLFSSIYGIFFSSESFNNSIPLNSVVRELNEDFSSKITDIKNNNPSDKCVINSNRTEWREVLSIYAVLTIKDKDVLTIDDDKKNVIKNLFWQMNEITYEVKEEQEEGVNKKVLYVNVNKKSIDEMKNIYNFDEKQNSLLDDLLDEKYSKMWLSTIYGISVGNGDIVDLALSQVGNVGGEPYWRWYGFDNRIEWCAVFVSWLANQLGYIDAGIIPKFSFCVDGVNWFKSHNEWKESDYIATSGDIIFFDWESDGVVDHVGIVERVENGIVYTIEGNSTNDTCLERTYSIDSKVIYGYGTPHYK